MLKKYGNIALVVFIGVFLFFLTGLNHGCGGGKPVHSDTVIVHDTIPGKDSSYPVYVPRPYPVPGKETQLPPQYVQLPADTSAWRSMIDSLARRLYAVNAYNDSFDLKDSLGESVATFRIKDTVTENLIKKRAPGYTVNPRTRDTVKITNTVTQDPRFQVYWGLGVLGTTKSLSGLSGGLLTKDKKDRITQFKVEATNVDGKIKPQFELSKYYPIKFKK